MDLATLFTACTLTVDPKIMYALTWHQSGGEPWARCRASTTRRCCEPSKTP